MSSKICATCNAKKSYKFFYLNKRAKDGYNYSCSDCVKSYMKEYGQKTKTHLKRYVANLYKYLRHRIQTSENYRDKKCTFSLSEFYAFSLDNKNLKRLYVYWQRSGFKVRLRPTVDRINNNGDYMLDNIQFLTLSDNASKDYCYPYRKIQRKVKCIETGIIYKSIRNASRHIKICDTSIAYACNGKRPNAKGYHWEYVN